MGIKDPCTMQILSLDPPKYSNSGIEQEGSADVKTLQDGLPSSLQEGEGWQE